MCKSNFNYALILKLESTILYKLDNRKDKIKMTDKQIEILEKAAKSPEELIALAKENDYEMSMDEAKSSFESLHNKGELTDDELDNVSGGGCVDPSDDESNPKFEIGQHVYSRTAGPVPLIVYRREYRKNVKVYFRKRSYWFYYVSNWVWDISGWYAQSDLVGSTSELPK